MGQSVDLHIFELDPLLKALDDFARKVAPDRDRETIQQDAGRISAILLACGEPLGDKYVIVSNELCEESNPAWTATALIDEHLGVEDGALDNSFSVMINLDHTWGTSSIDADEVKESIGLSYKERDRETS